MSAEIIKAEDYGLESTKANELTSGLSIVKEEKELLKAEFKEVSKLEITAENIPTFRALRLKVRDNRTKRLDKWKTAQKAYFLAGGNFVQAIYNKEVLENKNMEDFLTDAEKFFENQEKERIAKLQEQRALLLSEYVEDANERDLASMEQDVWESYLEVKKNAHIAKVEAEYKAEKERQAQIKKEEAEREAQRLENLRLKAEAEKREAEIKAEKERLERETELKKEIVRKRSVELQPYIIFIRDYNGLIEKTEVEYQKEFLDIKKGAEDHWEFERKEQIRKQKEEEARNEKARQEHLKALAKEKKEREEREEKERIENEKKEAILKKEREEKEAELERVRQEKAKLEAEIKAKKEAHELAEKAIADAKIKAEKEREELAKAPIKKQLTIWVDTFELPHLKTDNEKANEIKKKFESFKSWAKKEIENI